MTEKKVLNPGRDEGKVARIKQLFEGNDALVYALRNFILQFEMTATELEMVKNLTSEQVDILRKEILPDMRDGNIGSENDIWGNLEFTAPEIVYPGLLLREKATEFISQQLNNIFGS